MSLRTLSTLGCVLLVATATACGSSQPSPKLLDSEKVERAIEQSSLTQRGAHIQVSCPAVAQQQGLTFACTTVGGSDRARFVVTQPDGSGRVHYEAR